MAGDWIKMRDNLWDDPRVSRLCDLTGQTEAAIIGGLYWLWATADQHTEDGCMPGWSLRQIDRKTGVAGLGEALCAINWLHDDPQGVVIVKFEEHNGTSAKRRCMDAQRKANSRSLSAPDADTGRTDAGAGADETRRIAELEEEKRREEKETTDAIASVAAKPPRATRKCPASFDPVVAADALGWIAEEAPGLDWKFETEKFRDHTFKNAISDWPGAWRNWMRRAQKDRLEGRRGGAPPTYRERDEARATARVHEMTGGLVSAKPAPLTRHNDALQEIFDATARIAD